MAEFQLPGALRRIRRTADLSQRALAEAVHISQSAVAQAESGRRDLPVGIFVRAAELAGLRLALLDAEGREVTGMADGTVRDQGGRRFPAHLDTRYGDEHWWPGAERYSRHQPWYTFDRLRDTRDYWRGGSARLTITSCRNRATRRPSAGHAPASGPGMPRTARVGATSGDALLPLRCARQPPAYPPRRGPLLGRPPRRGVRAFPAPR